MLLDGKLVSSIIRNNVKEEAIILENKYNDKITLAVVLVGEDPASLVYVRNKERACLKSNIESITIKLEQNTTQEDVISVIDELAKDDNINGILVQLPLPKHIDKTAVLSHIPYYKDVDGLTDTNSALLFKNEPGIVPCTPQGVVDLLEYYNIDLTSKKVAVIGRSILVGKPLSLLLSNKNATVTMCHSKTTNLKQITLSSDIVVVAAGKEKLLLEDMVNENSIIVDVGINRKEDGIVGDVDFENIKDKVQYITPVPGGCGPMTIAELLKNTIKCYKIQKNDKW